MSLIEEGCTLYMGTRSPFVSQNLKCYVNDDLPSILKHLSCAIINLRYLGVIVLFATNTSSHMGSRLPTYGA